MNWPVAAAQGGSGSGSGTLVWITGVQSEGSTLTCNINASSFESPTYQWKRDGVDIPGATSSTYALTGADVGTVITCSVTGWIPTSSGVYVPDATPPPPGSNYITTRGGDIVTARNGDRLVFA